MTDKLDAPEVEYIPPVKSTQEALSDEELSFIEKEADSRIAFKKRSRSPRARIRRFGRHDFSRAGFEAGERAGGFISALIGFLVGRAIDDQINKYNKDGR